MADTFIKAIELVILNSSIAFYYALFRNYTFLVKYIDYFK
ncbi:hypothetical protein HMPREF1866_02657 [Lachnoanaerobaculum saburreum]|uniref:Uncharacterized protein n=1 Tax=Lachnoanaerobaculum saburreum TaxID=467210 RepID=A0A133ZDS6_9FIRM|nr:hypothetical protein HMPREF9099_01496 [Lachnospiraceae bacterium oral taxon 082 str. F0431]KXB53585.1 hypothetical protein HMPREF1866_02657 [Lachnoanaerobaculum saburreum]